jgi:hypothetical protein
MSDQGVTPQDYMENWLLQINYPKISIQLSLNNASSTSVYFKQKRFTLDNKNPTNTTGISPFGYILCSLNKTYFFIS